MGEEENLQLPEKKQESRWGYDAYFESYLYRVGIEGNEGVDPIKKFPESIELNDAWHTALNRMKSESKKDGRERWAPVGMKKVISLDFIPSTSIKGHYTETKNLSLKEIEQE